MNRNLDIWSLPSAKQVMEDTGEDLSSGISLCIVMATPCDIGEYKNVLTDYLSQKKYLTVYQVFIPEILDMNFNRFQKVVMGDDYLCTTPREFIHDHATPEVILLLGFEDASLVQKREVISLMKRWANACNSCDKKKALCLIISGFEVDHVKEISPEFSYLGMKIISGFPSALEMQLFCRSNPGSPEITPDERWRETIISSLSGNDLDFASFLKISNLDNFEAIKRSILEFAENMEWDRQRFEIGIKDWKPIILGIKPEIYLHTDNIKRLWTQITVFTPEYGEEIHSAGLCLLEKTDEIKHRIWRSQAMIVLPVVDEFRLKIYSLVKKHLENTWGYDGIPEIGEIKYSMERLPFDALPRKQYYDSIYHAWDVRNKVSHLEVINIMEYKMLFYDLRKISQQILQNQ